MSEVDSELQTTAEVAKKVLLNMGQKEIPLTPENYQIWFEYCAGSNESIITDINKTITQGKSFTAETNKIIYDKHFGKEKEQEILGEIYKETQKILKEVLGKVLSTSSATLKYSEKLKNYTSKLNDVKDISEIKNIIENIVGDTSEMEVSTSSLQEQLENATTESKNLKEKLEKKEREILIDGLTGINNRKALDKKIKELNDGFEKDGVSFSVMMLDIDFFKKFNDTYGHKIGDDVLQIVGSTLQECTKGKDFPARYGGEEFVVLLPKTTLNNASTLADQIRQEISGKSLKLKKTGEKIGNITSSIGVSQIKSGDTIETIIERADKALYLAKDSGRNNVKTENDSPI